MKLSHFYSSYKFFGRNYCNMRIMMTLLLHNYKDITDFRVLGPASRIIGTQLQNSSLLSLGFSFIGTQLWSFSFPGPGFNFIKTHSSILPLPSPDFNFIKTPFRFSSFSGPDFSPRLVQSSCTT